MSVRWRRCRPRVRKSFLVVDDIVTATGYPIQFPNKLHCRTLLIITYRRSSELCQAVAAAPRRGRRRRRQATGSFQAVSFSGEQLLLTRSIVSETLSYQTYDALTLFAECSEFLLLGILINGSDYICV